MTPKAGSFRPQLATLVSEAPQGDEWLHEIKFDGYRVGCFIERGVCRIVTRNGNDWTDRFPTITEAASRLPVRSALLDGEVTILLPDGRTSFQALQNSFGHGGDDRAVYFVFDLLSLDGRDVSAEPLEERKRELAGIIRRSVRSIIRYADHTIGDGPRVLAKACNLGLEGIVSKRRDLEHQAGRTRTWLKCKCIKRQEFVIGGFTDPEGSREGIGALLVGVRDRSGGLTFSGKVGTGFTRRSALELRSKLEAIEARACPFSNRPRGSRGVHWVRPVLVAEVTFTEWTAAGKIRHPSFQGLREDKGAEEVVRESPVPATGEDSIAGVRITHPERLMFPQIGVTKAALARFYDEIAEWILPHVIGRPLTLVRCPKGVSGECFYMKHSKLRAREPLRRVRIREKTKTGEYLVVESKAALVALVQMDVLEIHTWNSKIDRIEFPDRIVFDLDPGPEVKWAEVVATARLVRRELRKLGLTSFVKTTGGAGLHVVVPLLPRSEWARCLAFSKALAESIARREPTRYTTRFAKAGRERMVLIDYLRNNRTNTSVAAYSTRAKPTAPISVPLAWEELEPSLDPSRFTVATLSRRFARLRDRDPWKGYGEARQSLGPEAWKRIARDQRAGAD